MQYLDFEKNILELNTKLEEFRRMSGDENSGLDIGSEIQRIEKKIVRLTEGAYAKLTPAQIVQVARHGERPHSSDYIRELIEDFTPLAGDRLYGEDHAILSGLGRFRGTAVAILGHEKGSDTTTRLHHNFGMAKPEGYRKSQRLMDMASRFGLPVITFVDTAGAYPGVEAEERGQSEAIAQSIASCLDLNTPMVSTIIGEGGSGGAIAIAAADHVMMLEYSIYSVISPEGCASILWRSAENAADAANALRLTAKDLYELKLIDEIIPEPLGAAHRNRQAAIANVGNAIDKALDGFAGMSINDLKKRRRDKYLQMGA